MPQPQRRYAFTHYDPQPPKFDPVKHHYLCFQREIGEESKRIHWQGYVELTRPMRYKAMFKSMGLSHEGHLEEAKGNAEENKKYCHKLETRFPGAKQYEFGTPCAQGVRTDLKSACLLVQTRGIEELKKEHPEMYVRYHKGFEKLVEAPKKDQPRSLPPEVVWLYGPTGSGKTYFAEQFAKENKLEYYMYNPSLNGFWQKYNQEPVLIIDDMRATTFKFDELLRILDRYKHIINQKQGDKYINSPYIFITAPLSPQEMFPSGKDLAEHDQAQLLRRIDKVIYTPPRDLTPKVPVRFKFVFGKLEPL